jgi:hypothetical protein
MESSAPDGRNVFVDLTAGKRPVNAPEGAEVVGGDWLALFLLGAHLTGEGLEVQPGETTLGLGFGGVTCRARVDKSYDGSSASVPLWFDVTLPDAGVTIQESLAAPVLSNSPGAALQSVQDAVHFFLQGSLAPIRHLYGAGTPDDGVEKGSIESLADGISTSWELFIGPALPLAAESGSFEGLKQTLRKSDLFAAVFPELVGVLERRRVHWCKVFIWRNAAGVVGGLVAVDNREVPQALEALKKYDLPGTGRAMARQFAIMRPTSSKTRPVEPSKSTAMDRARSLARRIPGRR